MDELLALEDIACAWFDAEQDVRHPLYKEFNEKVEVLVERMPQQRAETRNLVKVLAFDALWQCPATFALILYPDACSALCGYVNLGPFYALYKSRCEQPRVALRLIQGGQR